MLISEHSKSKHKPKGSTEAASVQQVDGVNRPAKSYDEAAWDEPLGALLHSEEHALQKKCWSVIGEPPHRPSVRQ